MNKRKNYYGTLLSDFLVTRSGKAQDPVSGEQKECYYETVKKPCDSLGLFVECK